MKHSLRTGLVKGTVEEVTLALLDCKRTCTWEQKHLPIESTVPLPEYPHQQDLFNSFVEVVASKKLLHERKGVIQLYFIVWNVPLLYEVNYYIPLFVVVVRRFDYFVQRFPGNVCGSVAIPHI